MICGICNRNLTYCICDDAERRINSIRTMSHVHIDVDAILAARHLAKFEIEADKKASAASKEAPP